MLTKRSFGLAAALIAAAPAVKAAVAYDFTITHTGGKDWRVESAVEVDGARQRVAFRTVTGFMAETAQSDYRADAFALATGDTATFYYPAQKQVLQRHIAPGAMFQLKQQVEGDVTHGIGTSAEDVRVSVKDLGDGGVIEGLPTHKVEIQISFVNGVIVGGYKASGKREYTTQVWTTDRIDPAAAAFITFRQFRDQMPAEVMRQIEQRDKFAQRFVLRRVTTARIPVSGQIVTTVTEEAVTNFHPAAIPDGDFAAPAGYEAVKHAPVPPR